MTWRGSFILAIIFSNHLAFTEGVKCRRYLPDTPNLQTRFSLHVIAYRCLLLAVAALRFSVSRCCANEFLWSTCNCTRRHKHIRHIIKRWTTQDASLTICILMLSRSCGGTQNWRSNGAYRHRLAPYANLQPRSKYIILGCAARISTDQDCEAHWRSDGERTDRR